jgi:hypothetical protein
MIKLFLFQSGIDQRRSMYVRGWYVRAETFTPSHLRLRESHGWSDVGRLLEREDQHGCATCADTIVKWCLK